MIKVYHFETSMENYAWHKIFCNLTDYYANTFNAEIIHLKSIISQVGQTLFCSELNYNMSDCDFIVYDTEKDVFKIITWSESNTVSSTGYSIVSALQKRNNSADILLVSHWSSFFYDASILGCKIPSSFKFKILPTTWYPFKCKLNYDDIYESRKSLNLKDKLFWRSTTRREDPYKLADLGICDKNTGTVGNMEIYIQEASKYKLGLAISSVAEKCYREMEYMAIGLPFIRLEFIGEHNPPLIPDYHYISVNRKENNISMLNWGCNLDRAGGPEYVNAYKKRFYEVKDDLDFLNFISENARKYYTEYCEENIAWKNLVNLLEE